MTERRAVEVLGLMVAIWACVAAWLVVPPVQALFQSNRATPTISFEHAVETAVVDTAIAKTQTPHRTIDTPFPAKLPTATLRPSPTPFYDINLLYNGDFEKDFDGWERVVKDEGGSGKIQTISFGSTHNGKGVHIMQTGMGAVGIHQIVPIDDTNIWFIATFQMENQNTQLLLTGAGGCLLGLDYGHSLDNGEIEWLGSSFWLNYDISFLEGTGPMGSKIQDTNSVHYIAVENGNAYIDQRLNIYDEIQSNLLALDPGEITHVSVTLYCISTTPEDATMSLTAGDLILAQSR